MSVLNNCKRGFWSRKAEINWYLLAIILGIVLIVFVVFFLFVGNKTNWKFLRDLPVSYNDSDKFIGLENLSEEELAALDCNAVGRVLSNGFISIASVPSKLFLDEKIIYLDVLGWNNKEIGHLKGDKVLINSEYVDNNRDFQREIPEEGVPTIKDFNILNNAYLLYGTYFCKSDEQMIDYETVECVETCELYGGVCKSPGARVGQISYEQLDCKENERCFVSLEGEEFSEGLKMKKFEYSGENNEKKISLDKFEGAKFATGDRGYINYEIKNDLDSFCFILKTDKEKFAHNLYDSETVKGRVYWFTSNEDSFEYIIWNPSENKLVSKRMLIDTSETKQEYLGKKILTYESFKEIVLEGKSGKNYPIDDVIVISKDIINIEGKPFREFNLVRTVDDRVMVFARVDEVDKWHRLDCYKDWFQIGGIFFDEFDLHKDELKSSLRESLKNCRLL
jgi:hypothetical protein